MDETFVRIGCKWLCVLRAVDSAGETVDFYLSETRDREAAKLFLKVLANTDYRAPRVFACDGLRSSAAALGEIGPDAKSALPALRRAAQIVRLGPTAQEAMLRIEGKPVPTWWPGQSQSK